MQSGRVLDAERRVETTSDEHQTGRSLGGRGGRSGRQCGGRDASGLARWLEPDKTRPADHTLSARRDAIPLAVRRDGQVAARASGIDMRCGSAASKRCSTVRAALSAARPRPSGGQGVCCSYGPQARRHAARSLPGGVVAVPQQQRVVGQSDAACAHFAHGGRLICTTSAAFHRQTHPCSASLLDVGRGSWLAAMIPVSSPPQVRARCRLVAARDWHPKSPAVRRSRDLRVWLSRDECGHIGTTNKRGPIRIEARHPHYVTAICLLLLLLLLPCCSRAYPKLRKCRCPPTPK